MKERRNCFGTKEYSKGSGICTGCPNHLECGDERKRNIEKRKLELLEERKLHDKKQDDNI